MERDEKGRFRKRDGMYLSSNGYVVVNVGVEHPLADPKGFCPLHTLIWVAAGRKRARVKENTLLHHINGNKLDNRLENLVLLEHDEHTSHHNAIAAFEKQREAAQNDDYPDFEGTIRFQPRGIT